MSDETLDVETKRYEGDIKYCSGRGRGRRRSYAVVHVVVDARKVVVTLNPAQMHGDAKAAREIALNLLSRVSYTGGVNVNLREGETNSSADLDHVFTFRSDEATAIEFQKILETRRLALRQE